MVSKRSEVYVPYFYMQKESKKQKWRGAYIIIPKGTRRFKCVSKE